MRGTFATTTRIAAVQHGRVASGSFSDADIDRHTIQRWLVDGRLHRVHHGVYAVGHVAPSVHADYMAAVLCCGAGTILTHRAAAYLMLALRGACPPPAEVTVPTIAGRRRPGIVIHRVRALPDLDTAIVDGTPIATVPRILLDLAPSATLPQLTRLCHEAWVRHRIGRPEIEACIDRNPTKKGAAKLRRAIGATSR